MPLKLLRLMLISSHALRAIRMATPAAQKKTAEQPLDRAAIGGPDPVRPIMFVWLRHTPT